MQKSKLTLYILIALILGVITGYLYNMLAISQVNTRISNAESGVSSVQKAIPGLKDTADLDYKMLVRQRTKPCATTACRVLRY